MSALLFARVLTCGLVFFCAVRLAAETPPPSTAVVMVEIQCQPGTSDRWRDAFEKEEVPVIRELVRKGDLYTAFTYFEAPVPAQNTDFVLLFEIRSFGLLDTRRPFPHLEGLFRRMGPARFEAYEKQAGEWEKTVRVTMLRSFKVQ
jgi:hypothetical protein